MKAASPPRFLRLGDDGERERRLAGGFRAEDLHDAAAREAADAERAVDEEVAGRDDLDVDVRVLAQAHDRAVAEVLVDLLDGEVEILRAGLGDLVGDGFGGRFFGCARHGRGWVGGC